MKRIKASLFQYSYLPIRTEWGLKANPGKLGKQVLIQANLENYFSVPGLKSPTSIVEVAK